MQNIFSRWMWYVFSKRDSSAKTSLHFKLNQMKLVVFFFILFYAQTQTYSLFLNWNVLTVRVNIFWYFIYAVTAAAVASWWYYYCCCYSCIPKWKHGKNIYKHLKTGSYKSYVHSNRVSAYHGACLYISVHSSNTIYLYFFFRLHLKVSLSVPLARMIFKNSILYRMIVQTNEEQKEETKENECSNHNENNIQIHEWCANETASNLYTVNQ